MRPLTKLGKPQVLVTNERRWTDEYVAATTSAERKKREKWGHPDIRATLTAETVGKCAYCESTIGHVSYPNVEHIIPKAKRADLAHEWNNLTSACEKCNGAKSDYYDESLAVLSPYEDSVEQRLIFYGDFVDWVEDDDRGEVTVKQLRLNRIDLVHERVKRLAEIREMYERWRTTPEGAKRTVLAAAIRIEAREGDFTRAVTAYLSFKHFPTDPASSGAA